MMVQYPKNNMLNCLKKQAALTNTENGALTNSHSGSFCLDLFFEAGAMRNVPEEEIAAAVTRAFAEDRAKTMKIIFFARDVRGGLGERRFFRTAVKALADYAPEAVERNIPYFAEYGRFDDLCVLLGTQCENAAVNEIKKQLDSDLEAMSKDENISLLAKWLPSVNTSSEETRKSAKHLAKKLGYSEKTYRQTLSKLRKYLDILENRLRIYDYTFDYSSQPSCAMFKYRKAFMRNDEERYTDFLNKVNEGKETINTSVLYPYEVIRRCLSGHVSKADALSLDTFWKNLPEYGKSGNSIAVVDGSGSMTCAYGGNVRPIDVALSLGIYFAQHNKGAFANHFITFSYSPRLVEIKGSDIVEQARFCSTYNEVANTDIEKVFNLILSTAVNNKVKQSELPEKIYIISDMEFDYCISGGNNTTLFNAMKKKFSKQGYKLPDVIFWNVNSHLGNFPVTMSQTGAALVSGCTPAIFDMAMSGEISPEKIMEDTIQSERYAKVG